MILFFLQKQLYPKIVHYFINFIKSKICSMKTLVPQCVCVCVCVCVYTVRTVHFPCLPISDQREAGQLDNPAGSVGVGHHQASSGEKRPTSQPPPGGGRTGFGLARSWSSGSLNLAKHGTVSRPSCRGRHQPRHRFLPPNVVCSPCSKSLWSNVVCQTKCSTRPSFS